MRRWAGRWIIAALAVMVVAGAGAWAFWPSSHSVTTADVTIGVMDGPAGDQRVRIDATFFTPPGGGRAPAVLLAHGFGGTKASVRDEAERLAAAGYAVLTWSARGFGRTTGQIALNSPDYEVKDTRQLVDWLAARPEVRLDAKDDPRVGIAGASYGGAIALMTAAHDPRVDAIVPQITWHDLATALFPDATGQGPEHGVFKRMWAGIFFGRAGPPQRPVGAARTGPATPLTAEQAACGRFLPEICDLYRKVAETGRATPEAVELLRRSSPVSVPGMIRIPTLLLQGQRDSLFPLDQADANARAVAATGAPVQVAWFDGGHDGGDGEIDWIHERTVSWFGHFLARDGGLGVPGSAFTVTRDGGRDPGSRQPVLLHATAGGYPGLGGSARTTLPLSGPEQRIAAPPGGAPAAVSSIPGFGAPGAGGAAELFGAAADVPGQSASFETRPLARPVQVTGSPAVTVRVSGTDAPGREVTLFAGLQDVAADTRAPVLPKGLVAPVRFTVPDGGGEVAIRLPAIDHRFAAGHRLRVAIGTTDLGYAMPDEAAVHTIALPAGGGTLTLPGAALETPPAGPVWWAWALPPAALAVAALIALTGRRRRTAGEDAPDEDVPLRISGLTKSYRNGERAVTDLSFAVRRGQVLGLLGPNGAGKTTTLRMLMGLITPDAGEIRIFGRKVTPGAPVLSRIGCFVEGPGFLPHLTGRANLELYWRATGRPAADARMAEALEIAGLGGALDRAVRTYSQGMRQRLAIAQAMLGLPDLLVLDEPANGLDPPQIREMRRVLIRYAEQGRTVIVSSHLLAEVEQTCDHVVVMHRGRLVTAGPVSELLESAARPNGSARRLEDVFLTLIGDNA
ncbi:ABC transporter ATP-binding protein [Spongiactinospora gelatinilytica]|uniref:ABC transporter ATP-binding protein n=1 Tax=Spongiactinospora gelatinilytica TaxID=2666298 RepID=A0A2W2HLY0_9ACTN|nr:alpha/beta fold hydrolase [Spongiactinospora gelatinilytica]PZG50748.1 ABC transporter ATP-binding protein [Spongiactinospora gelatinilytica]